MRNLSKLSVLIGARSLLFSVSAHVRRVIRHSVGRQPQAESQQVAPVAPKVALPPAPPAATPQATPPPAPPVAPPAPPVEAEQCEPTEVGNCIQSRISYFSSLNLGIPPGMCDLDFSCAAMDANEPFKNIRRSDPMAFGSCQNLYWTYLKQCSGN